MAGRSPFSDQSQIATLRWVKYVSILWFLHLTPAVAQGADIKTCEDQFAADWIAERFSDAPIVTGQFKGRVTLDAPAWVKAASVSDARYGISVQGHAEQKDRHVAITDVHISDLRSKTQYGAGIRTHRNSPDIVLFLNNVTVTPNWPDWISYKDTNYDGIVLDGAAALFAQNLHISNWNADAAIDNKARISQLVDLTVSGSGHRPLRYWTPGPHYLIHSTIDKPDGGVLIWFADCSETILHVYKSAFNGDARLSPDAIECAAGDAPNIVYHTEDPRKSGEMHPMFTSCSQSLPQ